MLQYTVDNNNDFPPGQDGTGVGWAGELYPYVKSTDVFVCPDDERNQAHVVSYGYNSNVAALALRRLSAPAKTVMGFEVTRDRADVTQADEGAAHGAATFSAAGNGLADGLHSRLRGPDSVQYARARHDGGGNWLFADGHVKYLRYHAPGDPQAPSYKVKP